MITSADGKMSRYFRLTFVLHWRIIWRRDLCKAGRLARGRDLPVEGQMVIIETSVFTPHGAP